MIHEILPTGRENAIPGKQIAACLGMELRDVTKRIERERQYGNPICAAVAHGEAGYFLPGDASELALYLASLDRRLRNIQRTRSAMGDVLAEMVEQEQIEGWGEGFE